MEILSRYASCSPGQSHGLSLKPSNDSRDETFAKCSILVKIKEGEEFLTTGIYRIFRGLKSEPDAEIGQISEDFERGRFAKVSRHPQRAEADSRNEALF